MARAGPSLWRKCQTKKPCGTTSTAKRHRGRSGPTAQTPAALMAGSEGKVAVAPKGVTGRQTGGDTVPRPVFGWERYRWGHFSARLPGLFSQENGSGHQLPAKALGTTRCSTACHSKKELFKRSTGGEQIGPTGRVRRSPDTEQFCVPWTGVVMTSATRRMLECERRGERLQNGAKAQQKED